MQSENVEEKKSVAVVPEHVEEEVWFEAAPSSSRRPSTPPPAEVVGEFLGDPLADAWLR